MSILRAPALLTILLLSLAIPQVLPCLCSILKNFKCPSPPPCCESGQYTLDECGCCPKCAKAELQTCGGASDILGNCAQGLQCLKTCTACRTVGSSGVPCVFPFIYREVTYNSCTDTDSDTGQPWCATEVDTDGWVVDHKWGDCGEGCPGTIKPCDDRFFSIQDGKCIDVSVPGAIPNWFGAPSVRLEPPTATLFPAPVCQHSSEAVRLYDNTCRCTRGPSAVDTDLEGKVRGNCTGQDEDTGDNLNKVWCFLENIRDPLEPQSGCYSDVTWSERDGRFWSSKACFQAPDIEGGAVGDRRHQESGPTFEEFQQERQAARTSVSPVSLKTETTTEKSFNQYEDHLFSAQYEEYEYFEDEISNHETLSIIDVDISKNLVDPEAPSIFLPTVPPLTTSAAPVTASPGRGRNRFGTRRPPTNPQARRRTRPSSRPRKTSSKSRVRNFPNFRRRPQTPRRRKNKIGANTIEEVTESFRSSGGRLKNQDTDIALAIPLFENDEIFKKIKEVTTEPAELFITLGDSFTSADKVTQDSVEVQKDGHKEVSTIPNVFKNLPTLSTNRRDRPSINAFKDHQQTTELITLSSKSNVANAQVSEPTLDALNIQYNTIIRQEVTSIITPTLVGSNEKLIQTSTATTKEKPFTSTLSTSTSTTKTTTFTSSTKDERGTSSTTLSTSTSNSNTTTINSSTGDEPETSTTTSGTSTTPVTKTTALTSSTIPLTSAKTSQNSTQSPIINSNIQNISLNSLQSSTSTTARQITDSTESGDSLETQSDGQETKGDVKQISRDQKIDDTTAESATTGSILSDHLVSAVQGGLTNQDEIDRAALSAELKSIVRSGILDLGVLGLWERDPEEVKTEINNSIPRPVYKPKTE